MQLQRKWWLSASMLVVLGGCVMQVPESIAAESPNNLQLAQVRAQPNDYDGHEVRWGGTITAVENRGRHETVLVIASRALNNEGKPQTDTSSQGHFMAKISEFLNPNVYAAGRFVTVSGTVVGSESRDIGNDPDSYPFVAADDYYLWPESRRTAIGYHYSCPDSYPWYSFGYGQHFGSCP